MNIQYMSDLHWEHYEPEEFKIIGDVIVFAGDIGRKPRCDPLSEANCRKKSTCCVCSWKPRVLLQRLLASTTAEVPGNCFGTKSTYTSWMTRIAISVTTVFFGTTLWSELRCHDSLVEKSIHDFQKIKYNLSRKLTPDNYRTLNEESSIWLKKVLLSCPKSKKKVVVSHFLPSAKCIEPQYIRDPRSYAYFSRAGEMIAMADLWIHGHTHASFQKIINKTPVVCNAKGHQGENPDFNYHQIFQLTTED